MTANVSPGELMHAANAPTLSVVVPIYNVDRYLDECLRSLATQEVQNFEAILVDDGSTDRSADIASRWCEQDSRFRLVTQENHGLGHARNTGVPHVTGKYLAFLDSDDVVPPDAYSTMIDSLEKSGSDFATGNVLRFDSTGQWQAPLYNWMVKFTELRTTNVKREPKLLRDHLAHNKVWRTSFWRESGAEFPVGVLYEDVPTTIPAHVSARAVDIVPVVAILWRIRDQGDSSITQNRNRDAAHIRDRVDGVLTASQFVGRHAGQKLKDEYDYLVLRRDLRWYVDLYPDVDEEYRAELFESIGRFLEQTSPKALRRVHVNLRPAYALIEAGARDDFAEFVELRLNDQVAQLPTVVRNSRALIDLSLSGGTALPEDALDVSDQLAVKSKVSSLSVTDTDVEISGWAYLSQLPLDGSEAQEVKVWLEASGRKAPATVTYRHDSRAAEDVSAAAESTGRLAFTARIPLKSLRLWPKRRGTTWRANVSVNNSGIEKAARIQQCLMGAAERPIMRELPDGRWLRLSWDDKGLACRIRRESAVLTDVTSSGQEFELTLRTSALVRRSAQVKVRVTGADNDRTIVRVSRDRSDRKSAYVTIPVDALPGIDSDQIPQSWDLLFRKSKSRPWQRIQDPHNRSDGSMIARGREIFARRTRGATMSLSSGVVAPVLTDAAWTSDGALVLSLTHAGTTPFESVVVQARQRHEAYDFPVRVNGPELTATIPVFDVPRFGATVPLRAGLWDLAARSGTDAVPIRVGCDAVDTLPAEITIKSKQAVLTDVKRESLSLDVSRDIERSYRGVTNQARIRKEIYPQVKTTIRDAVLYETDFGNAFSDSPRRIFDELRSRDCSLEHLVVVDDQQFAAPEGAVVVPKRSVRYYEALAQSRYIVTNGRLPTWFTRADGQIVLQTWHTIGPAKIGFDRESVYFTNKARGDNHLEGEADQWDYLISSSPLASPIMQRAFAFNNTLLETGSPRNDVFHQPNREELAAQVRRRLGVAEHKTVVLFAPTRRDNSVDSSGRHRLDLRIDLHNTAKQLGDDYALLFRKHPRVVDRHPFGDGPVIDVSDYPDVHELMLIADMLVTDYSSLTCDFANTGRPMIFFTYDLANYRDALRGFYIDFENEAPGPLIMDEDGLVPAILDAEKLRADYKSEYELFAGQFCAWDDGQATARVVDAVFGIDELNV